MGFFGGKKVYVSSSAYNLAGDETLRPDYLKTMVVGNVLTPGQSMSDALTKGYLSGPAIKLRQFYNWTSSHYVGPMNVTSGGLAAAPQIDPNAVASQIQSGGETVMVQSIIFGIADFEFWAEQYMLEHHQDLFQDAWMSDYDANTSQVVITLPDGSTESFTPAEFDKHSFYIFATYNLTSGQAYGDVTQGNLVTLGSGDAFPDTTGWTEDSYTSTQHSAPDYTEFHGVWEKTEYKGDDGTGRLYSLKSTMYQDQTGAVDGSGNLVLTRTYRIDTQEITVKQWSPLKILIYRVGSGNAALDGAIGPINNWGGFFPPIPVRLDNKFVSSTYHPDVYDLASKAYKKLTAGAKFDDLITKISSSDKLGDMDYIYVLPGVSLNVKDNSCRKYIYQFFENCMTTQMYNGTHYTNWSNASANADSLNQSWISWRDTQATTDPNVATDEPLRTTYPNAPKNLVEVKSTHQDVNFKQHIQWDAITEDFGSGLAKSDAVPGEVWIQKEGTALEIGAIWAAAFGGMFANDTGSDTVYIIWQVDADSWRRLTIRGLEHVNFVYQGHAVITKAGEALADADESGFIIPLHYDTLTAMPIKDATQLATACLFVVINCYKVVKQKWWQTGFFKVVLFVAVIVITIMTFGAGSAVLAGPTSLGVTLGFTGVMATIIGLAINAIGSMILFKILSAVAVAAFGDKLGTIIAAVAMVVTLQVWGALENGQSLAQAFSHLMDPISLIKMTEAVGNGVIHLIQSGIQDTLSKTQDVLSQYNQQSKAISDLYAQNIGYGNGIIDPLSLTDVGQWYVEPGDTFLTRTLMTGSDIAEFSTSLIGRFPELTLSTDLPI